MRRRQFMHVVNLAVRSPPPIKWNPVPRSVTRLRVRARRPIDRGNIALSGRFRCSFGSWLRSDSRVSAGRRGILRGLGSSGLRCLRTIRGAPPRSATAKKANTKRASYPAHPDRTALTSTGSRLCAEHPVVRMVHDCEVGGGALRRAAIRASSLLAASFNFCETSRKNSALRRSVSGATSCSTYRRSRVNSSSMRLPNSSNLSIGLFAGPCAAISVL